MAVDEVIVASTNLIQELFDRDPLITYAPPLNKYPNSMDKFNGIAVLTEHSNGLLGGNQYNNYSLDSYISTIYVNKLDNQLKVGTTYQKLAQVKDSLRATLLATNSYPVSPGTKVLQETPYHIVIADDLEKTNQTFTFSRRENIEYPLNSGFVWSGFTITYNVVAENFSCG